VRKSLAVTLLIAVLAAGCGGGAVSERPTTTQRQARRSPAAAKYVRDYKLLSADVGAMRAQTAKTKKSSLLGTRGLRRTTAAFLDDLGTSVLGPKARNRMIDHAAAAVATRCEQCFQMLEAVRPIPEIAGH
jgi:hypothetical protein